MNYITDDQIIEKLKNNPDNKPKTLMMFLIVPNPKYNPKDFLYKMEDLEKEIRMLKTSYNEMKKSDFDTILENTICNIKNKADKLRDGFNSTFDYKLISVSLTPTWHGNICNFYSDDNFKRILQIREKYGGIVDFS